MKRLFVSFMVVALVLLWAVTGFATTDLTDTKAQITNNTVTSVFTVIPGFDYTKHWVTKVTVGTIAAGGAGTENVVCVYDASRIGLATAQFAEGEFESNDKGSITYTYHKPLRMSNGLVIGQGALTVVFVEWEYKF